MPTQKQILASIDDRLGVILAAMQKPVVVPPAPEPPVVMPPVVTPPVVTPTGDVPWALVRPFVMPAIVRQPAELIALRLVPPFDPSVIRGSQGGQAPNTPGIWPGTRYFSGTGEREDIGMVIEDAAIWLHGKSSPSDMIIWAEAYGQVPVHFRLNDAGQPDSAGRQMVDVFKYPKAHCYEKADEGSPHFPISGPIQPDSAHHPGAAYVQYLATFDPFYLTQVQDCATYMIISSPPGWGRPPGGVPEGQVRAYAWGLLRVAQAYLATKEAEKRGALPVGLFASSYWKRVLDVNCARFKDLCVLNVKNDPMVALGFMQPESGFDLQFWMQDMLGSVIGWMIWSGQFPEWRENYDWCMKQLLLRTSGKSGFPRTRAVQYSVKCNGVNDLAGLVAANNFAEIAGDKLDVMDASYGAYLRANAAFAKLNSVPGTDEPLAWLDPQIKWIPAKWAV